MRRRALLAIAASAMGWGMAAVGTRALFIQGTTTFTVIVLRTAVAALAVVTFLVFVRRPISAQSWRRGLLIGAPRIGVAPIFYIASLNFVSAGFEGLIITLNPAITGVMAWVFLKERISKRMAVGLTIALAGAAILVTSGESGIPEGGNVAIGTLLALGGVLVGSGTSVLSRRFAPEHRTGDLAGPMFVGGIATVTAASFFFGGVEPSTITGEGWPILIALGLFSTLLPFVGTLFASKYVPAATVALVAYVAPLIAVVGGVVLLGEIVTPPVIIGGALTIAGVITASR